MADLVPTSHTPTGWQFWIDRGGTFTDVVARRPDGTTITHKLLSDNPRLYDDAAIQGIRDLLGLDDEEPIPPGVVDAVKMARRSRPTPCSNERASRLSI